MLYRDPSGRLGYVKSGTDAPVTPLTSLPVPIKDLRFGDFDGDGLTDMFYTRQNQWQVWYGRTRTWTPTQTSGKPISELLFGEFDGVRGTDVVGINGDGWAYSSASTQSWARLNGRLTSSFSKAVAADFDGNGWTDIAIGDGQTWRWSRDGRTPLAVMRNGDSRLTYPALNRLPIGRFDGGARHKVISFNLTAQGSPGNVRYSAGRVARHLARPGQPQQLQRPLIADHALSGDVESEARWLNTCCWCTRRRSTRLSRPSASR